MSFKLKSSIVVCAAVLVGLAVAAPAGAAVPSPLASMPTGNVKVHGAHGGGLVFAIDALGLTPGSAHEVALSTSACNAATGGSGVHVVHAAASGQLRASFQVSNRRCAQRSVSVCIAGNPGGEGRRCEP